VRRCGRKWSHIGFIQRGRRGSRLRDATRRACKRRRHDTNALGETRLSGHVTVFEYFFLLVDSKPDIRSDSDSVQVQGSALCVCVQKWLQNPKFVLCYHQREERACDSFLLGVHAVNQFGFSVWHWVRTLALSVLKKKEAKFARP
jgi:hypothetical protein